ncbi:MAG: arylsulfatase [Planctomycetes bacterium]|nr:arylsulfatase [Planctomycetota bacterium]
MLPYRLAVVLVLATAWLAAQSDTAAGSGASPRPATPNIVFVMADDLGYGELGCFGQEKIRTPRLDRLAAEGMRFTRHYCGSPVCAPSRCVLMTGKHPGHAAVRDNREQKPEGQWPLPAGETTMAEVLHAAGYATGGYGKWGLGPIGSTGDPLRRGFDHFFGYNCQRHAHSYWPSYLWDDDRRLPLNNDPEVARGGRLKPDEDPNDPKSYARFLGTDYAPDRILAAAKAFLRANGERPFFLYYPSVIPHLALHVPPAEIAAYDGEFEETPYTGGHGYTPQQKPRAAYAAMITRLDRSVGELLDVIDELGLTDDTIVVFTSDNGATHSPVGGTDVDFFESCGELRGRKGSMYEGGVRVPMIVRWPGVVAAGSTCDRVTGFEDWLPTFAELCAAEAPSSCDGISFVATLRGGAQPARDFLYREFAGYRGWQAIWLGNEKLLRRQLQPGPIVTELYDLAADPSEQHDLAAERPERVAELLALIAREHVPSATFPLQQIDGEPK